MRHGSGPAPGRPWPLASPPPSSPFARASSSHRRPARSSARPTASPSTTTGNPQYSTFSLCAIDPATGQSGAAVTTRVPFVGRAVPHVRAGVGAVCTQASTMVEYGPRGLDLMAKGVEPQAVLAQLLADDQQRESRQVGMIDMKGRAAAHTGKQNGNWAGSRQGTNYTVQANIMVGPGSGRGRGRDVRVHRGHRHAARRAHDPGARSRAGQGRRQPLGQPAVGGDQDRRSERSRAAAATTSRSRSKSASTPSRSAR